MHTKKSKNVKNAVKSVDYSNITLKEVLCPICREILTDPVTLPCNHKFCLGCFDGTVENNTLCCPICRKRIASWLRTVRKENKLVDSVLWNVIQEKFPEEVQKKNEGIGVDLVSSERINIQIASPGEIKREFEKQLELERLEREKKAQEEANASNKLIEEIKQQDEFDAAVEEEKLKLDEAVAQELNRTLNSDVDAEETKVPTPKIPKKKYTIEYFLNLKNPAKANVTATTSDTSKNEIEKTNNTSTFSFMKLYDKSKQIYFNRIQNTEKPQLKSTNLSQNSNETQKARPASECYDSSDSIKEEIKYFKPIRMFPITLPKPTADGQRIWINVMKIPAIKKLLKNNPVFRPPNHEHPLSLDVHKKSAFEYYKSLEETSNCTNFDEIDKPLLGFNATDVKNSQELNDYLKSSKEMLEGTNQPYSSTQNETVGTENFATLKLTPAMDETECETSKTEVTFTGEKSRGSNAARNALECKKSPKKKIDIHENFDPELKRKLQEQQDFEFARRLQQELNDTRMGTRSRITTARESKKNDRSRKRQITLHELVTAKKLKYNT